MYLGIKIEIIYVVALRTILFVNFVCFVVNSGFAVSIYRLIKGDLLLHGELSLPLPPTAEAELTAVVAAPLTVYAVLAGMLLWSFLFHGHLQ
jgi:hypothetical protein